MAESDDEYDRRRRDKFRRERSDHDKTRDKDQRRRSDTSFRRESERDRGRKEDYRDYDRNRWERYSPRHEISPPPKRMRREWEERPVEPYRPPYDFPAAPQHFVPPWGHQEMHPMQHHGIPVHASRLGNMPPEMEMPPPPPTMKSFKEFLVTLDDAVEETEAVKLYSEYKQEFQQQQMQDFFLAHKGEEWFRTRYHPDEREKRRRDIIASARHRVAVFCMLKQHKWLDNVTLDLDKTDQIAHFLDAARTASMLMEGGTAEDLKALEEREESKEECSEKPEEVPKEETTKGPEEEPMEESTEELKKESNDEPKEKSKEDPKEESKEELKAESKDGLKEESMEELKAESKDGLKEESKEELKAESKDGLKEESKEELKVESKDGLKEESKEDPKEELKEESKGESKEESKTAGEKPAEEQGLLPRPRNFHRNMSIFLRNIAPYISKAEIVSLCRRFPGFMRVALSEPQPERGFYRRGWVTFSGHVNIQDICWNLQNVKLRECELSPVVNRDLARRMRIVSGVSLHATVARNHLRLALKLVHALDRRAKLWEYTEGTTIPGTSDGANPLLGGLSKYL
uniref:SERRATE/Ars2 N-terminal domain-containing protein n=1 Tax=Petromyzon marinus TaxID=7757 RepID=S4R8Y0_PETMA